MTFKNISIIMVLFVSLAFAAGKKTYTQKEILQKLNNSFTQVQSLESEFVQEVESPYWGIKTSKGKMSILRPLKMRWDYESTARDVKKKSDKDIKPEKFFLADGKELKMYDPNLDQLRVEPQPKKGEIPLGISLLLGGQKPSEIFTIEILNQKGKQARLKMTPKKEQAGIKYIEMSLEMSQPLKILETQIFDQGGNKNTMTFKNIKQNQKIDSKRFEAKVPKKTVIIQGFSGSSFL